MPPKKYPEAEDRGDGVPARSEGDVIVLDEERRRRLPRTADTNANNEPAEPGAEGGGVQNEPI